MVYDTGLVVTAVHAGSDQALSATYHAIYVGVGGDVVVTLAGSGSDFTFKNLASGQLLPVQITHVKATNTTATSSDIECIPVNTTGFIMIEFSKDSGWTG